MKRTTFLFSICSFILLCQYVYGIKKIAHITEDYIKEFRAKTYKEPIDDLKDLDQNLPDVIEIVDKIKELVKIGSDLSNTVPDNGATCSVQLKFYITAIIDRAKEQCDFCVQANVGKENLSIMNEDQKKCTLDIITTAQNELYKLKFTVEHCTLII